jgi:hypothetical protein
VDYYTYQMTTTTPQQYPLPVSETTTSLVLVPSSSTTGGAAAAATSCNSVTKDQLKDYLRQWVRVENEISTLSAEIKKRKLIHQQLSSSLLKIMRDSDIDCFDIANGRIVYSKTKTRAPLNNGQLKSALTMYYKDEPEKAGSLTEFLLASRVEKTRETIKMKIPKNK